MDRQENESNVHVLAPTNARIDIFRTDGTEFDLPRRKGGYYFFGIETQYLYIDQRSDYRKTKRGTMNYAKRICEKLGYTYWFRCL